MHGDAGGGAAVVPPVISQPPATAGHFGPPAMLESADALKTYLNNQKITRVYCMKQFLCPEKLPDMGKQGNINKEYCRVNSTSTHARLLTANRHLLLLSWQVLLLTSLSGPLPSVA